MNIRDINRQFSEDVVSIADFKAKKGIVEPKDNITRVHIDSVIIVHAEGSYDDSRFPYGKEISLEEAQALINKEDYKKYIQGLGYDKCDVKINFTVNGEPKILSDYLKYSDTIRLDLKDGAKYGAEQVSIIANLKSVLESSLNNVEIDNKEIPYDKAAYEKEFGTKEENIKKYVDANKVQLPQGIDYSKKTVEEVAVGDIFEQGDYSDYSRSYYYDFYRVVKKTAKSVWFEPLKRNRVEEPIEEKGEIGYQGYQFPSDEVDTERLERGRHGMNFSKPFRLTMKYDNKLKAEQGAGHYKETLYPWNGKALKENFGISRSIYAKLNEEVCKFLEADTLVLVYVDGSDGSDERVSLYDGEKLIDWKAVDLDCPTDECIIKEAKKYFDVPDNIEVKRPLEVKEAYHPFDSEGKVEDREYKNVKYTVLPDGEYCDIKIYAPKGQKFYNGDTWYSTSTRLTAADTIVKEIVDGQVKRGYFVLDESLNEEKEKLDIRELIEGYNFSIIKTRVPEIEVLKKAKGDEVLFDAQYFEEEVGKPCFVLYDNMKYEIRDIFLGETLTPQISIDIVENLDVFIDDSIWEDVVDNFIPDEDRAEIHDFPELFEYLKSHDTGISEWETTVVEMLATGDKDLFKEITDIKEEDFKKALRIYESLDETYKETNGITFSDIEKEHKDKTFMIYNLEDELQTKCDYNGFYQYIKDAVDDMNDDLDLKKGDPKYISLSTTDFNKWLENELALKVYISKGNRFEKLYKTVDGRQSVGGAWFTHIIESEEPIEEKLQKIADEIKTEINKIYADDKDLLEYFFVESGVKKGHYDDGSDMNYIEVRTELGYNKLLDLSEKLDKIVQKYDEYAYFDMEGGGIIVAVIDLDKNESKDEYPKQLAKAIKKCWYGNYKDAGRYAKIGNWEIGLGGYDTGYEVSYNGTPIFAIRTTWGDNKVDMYQDEKDIKNLCGYNFKQIMKAINEVDSETTLNEPEQMYRLVIKTDEDNLSDVNEILGHYSEVEADDIDDNSYDSVICFYVNKNDQDILNQIYKDLKELNNDAIELKEPFEIY